MKFEDKYTNTAKLDEDKTGIETEKILLTNDAYAIAEMIQSLISKIESLRSLIK